MSLIEYPDVEQGTPEWHDLRRGIVTASTVGKLISIGAPDAQTVACPTCAVEVGPCVSIARKAPTLLKTAHSERTAAASEMPPLYDTADNDTSRGVTTTLVAERITGWTEDNYVSSDMWHGIVCEPLARDVYSKDHSPARQFGFMVRDDWGFSLGYSPDGLVGDDGLIEIKCPRAKTHLNTVLADEVPAYYMAQLQTGLLVSGREWIDFVSFVGGLPLYVKRVFPDTEWFAAIEEAVTTFEANAAQMIAAYESATKGLALTERVQELEMVL